MHFHGVIIKYKRITYFPSSPSNHGEYFISNGLIQVNSMLDLTSSGFLVFFVTLMYSLCSCFLNFQCSLIFSLKLISCGGFDLSISDWLSLWKRYTGKAGLWMHGLDAWTQDVWTLGLWALDAWTHRILSVFSDIILIVI